MELRGEAFDLLLEVSDFVFEDFDLTIRDFKFRNTCTQRGDFLLVILYLAAHEFDLLCEMHELFFEHLLVAQRHLDFSISLRSLDCFITQVARKFFDLSNQQHAILFRFREFRFELLDCNKKQVIIR